MIEGGLQTFGVACGQLVGYGFFFVKGQAQWRIPVGIQLVPALIVFIFINFLPESPRWLIKHGFVEEVCKAFFPSFLLTIPNAPLGSRDA
jgi:MFS family permease